jgi:heat-inducible transcriptional repressor
MESWLTSQMLSERAQHLLKALVERYIDDGQPVGSRRLAQDSGLNLSPATIRNVMSDLEGLGLVTSPHTSAGRVPTVTGYRMFVDSLLTWRTPADGEISGIKDQLDADKCTTSLIETASEYLSDISKMAGVVTLPKKSSQTLRQIEFLPLSLSRVLVILVTDEKEVDNYIIHTSREFSSSELVVLANYLTEAFAGQNLQYVRTMLAKQLVDASSKINRLMTNGVEVAQKALFSVDEIQDDFVLAGERNLVSSTDVSDINKLQSLFSVFSEKQELLSVLDQCIGNDGVRIFIGSESGYDGFGDCSVVSSPYQIDEQNVGVLAVIGPTRMAYNRVVPLVDMTSKILGAALSAQKGR